MSERSPVAVALGAVLAVLGVVLLLAALEIWRPSVTWAGPVLLIGAGLALAVAGARTGRGT